MSADGAADLELVRAVLETIIPPSRDGRMPGGGSLGLEASVAAALDGDPRSGPAGHAGLEALAALPGPGFAGLPAASRAGALRDLAAGHPHFIEAVARHLFLAYYAHPTVLAALGEPPRAPFPEGFTVEPNDPAMLDRLRQRARR